MKVLLLNTFSRSGGAAVAVRRIHSALRKEGLNAEIGSFYPENETSALISGNRFLNLLFFIMDRLQVRFLIKHKKWLYKYSTSFGSLDITSSQVFKEADVIHLNWINFGFLSVKQIKKIAEEKPLVWTFHDMWAFTGGCHYALACDNYKRDCHSCFYLRSGMNNSQRILSRKLAYWKDVNFNLVTCSNWLRECAESSSVFAGKNIKAIGNPIDTTMFRPLDKIQLRQKYKIEQHQFVLLIGAVDLTDERKGFSYLMESIRLMNGELPNLQLLTFGNNSKELPGVEVTSFGNVEDQDKLVEIYNLADLFILPSIQDNLPNTVMEASSCGVPVVAFDSGGVSDMVIHKQTGYLAENYNSQDLAEGIQYFKEEFLREQVSINARAHIENHFSEEMISKKYIKLYEQALNDFDSSQQEPR